MGETENKIDSNETYIAKYIRETAKKMGIDELPKTMQALRTIGEISVGLTALSATVTQVSQQIVAVKNEIGGTIEYVDSVKEYAFNEIPNNINNATQALGYLKDGLVNASEYLNVDSGKIITEVTQAKNYTDPLFKMLEKHPIAAAASLMAAGYLGYAMYNSNLEHKKNKLSLVLKEEESILENKFNQLAEHFKDQDDYNLKALDVFCRNMVEKYKESSEVDEKDVEQIKYMIENDLKFLELPSERIADIAKGSLELIDSVERCSQLKLDLSQDKSLFSFTNKLREERNKEVSAVKER
ncbi:MAG: hypothetical protein N4A31_01380 [Rickettsiales bacterium]|jgi:hypothetical protein|nr:hypothetical protein [Rickettsiales bacterium]